MFVCAWEYNVITFHRPGGIELARWTTAMNEFQANGLEIDEVSIYLMQCPPPLLRLAVDQVIRREWRDLPLSMALLHGEDD